MKNTEGVRDVPGWRSDFGGRGCLLVPFRFGLLCLCGRGCPSFSSRPLLNGSHSLRLAGRPLILSLLNFLPPSVLSSRRVLLSLRLEFFVLLYPLHGLRTPWLRLALGLGCVAPWSVLLASSIVRLAPLALGLVQLMISSLRLAPSLLRLSPGLGLLMSSTLRLAPLLFRLASPLLRLATLGLRHLLLLR